MAVSCGPGRATDRMKELLQAIDDGDGELAASMLSQTALGELSVSLERFKRDPGAAAQQLTAVGIPMTENELRNITPRAYAIKLVSSQATDEIMSSARPTVTHVAVEGDSATIQLEATINSAKQQMVIPMVVEDGEWKVTSLPINPVRIRFGL
jgi:hypothetical protein